MINNNILKKELNLNFTQDIINQLTIWEENFKSYNSHTNLMSKNDIEVLFEKHVFDSLAISKYYNFKNHKIIIDVGTGGGFPSVILAICFKNKKIIANDSRIKKINFLKEIKEKLNLENLEILYSRIEETKPLKVDLITSRAVGDTLKVFELSKKHLTKNSEFIIYKSKLTNNEIQEFQKKYKKADFEIISYKLPLKEDFKRNLIILKNAYDII